MVGGRGCSKSSDLDAMHLYNNDAQDYVGFQVLMCVARGAVVLIKEKKLAGLVCWGEGRRGLDS